MEEEQKEERKEEGEGMNINFVGYKNSIINAFKRIRNNWLYFLILTFVIGSLSYVSYTQGFYNGKVDQCFEMGGLRVKIPIDTTRDETRCMTGYELEAHLGNNKDKLRILFNDKNFKRLLEKAGVKYPADQYSKEIATQILEDIKNINEEIKLEE